jgi:hypothetical protein
MNEKELLAFKQLLGEIEGVVSDDNKAEINGRTYQLSKMTHKNRLPFLQYYQDIQSGKNSMDFEKLEGMLSSFVMFDGALMKNLPNHFDKYPSDYMSYINTFLMTVIYPFLSEQLRPLKDS